MRNPKLQSHGRPKRSGGRSKRAHGRDSLPGLGYATMPRNVLRRELRSVTNWPLSAVVLGATVTLGMFDTIVASCRIYASGMIQPASLRQLITRRESFLED